MTTRLVAQATRRGSSNTCDRINTPRTLSRVASTVLVEALHTTNADDVSPHQSGMEETVKTLVASMPENAQSNSYAD